MARIQVQVVKRNPSEKTWGEIIANILAHQNKEVETASIFLKFSLRTPRKCKYYSFFIEKHKSLTYVNRELKQGRRQRQRGLEKIMI